MSKVEAVGIKKIIVDIIEAEFLDNQRLPKNIRDKVLDEVRNKHQDTLEAELEAVVNYGIRSICGNIKGSFTKKSNIPDFFNAFNAPKRLILKAQMMMVTFKNMRFIPLRHHPIKYLNI